MSAECPVRKIVPTEAEAGLGLELIERDGEPTWVIRSFAVARQILRATDTTRQAGFGADRVGAAKNLRPPILYLEGERHREQRRAAARFFAPAVIEGYQPMIEQVSADLVCRLRTDRPVDLTALAMRLAVEVAGQVVGLTESSTAAMSRRLAVFFESPPTGGVGRLRGLLRSLAMGTRTAQFHYLDVRPAIRARRRRPREDVVSQLLSLGFRDLDILTECLTYAAAGMVTTRELIGVAAWHLIDEPVLLTRYRAGDTAARRALLEELLRVEPVVGFLRREVTRPVTVPGPDGPVRLEPGAAVDIRLRQVNADPEVVGPDGGSVCPGRSLPPAVQRTVMSFGDGAHRCPGGPLAIMESEIFLSRLFDRDLVADGPPRVRWNAVSQGYDLSRFPVRLAG